MKLNIFTDGGARGNPGPAATGVVIKDEQGQILVSYGEYLGRQTNNFAEYSAVISALKKAKELDGNEIDLTVDSKLVAEQLNGNWKVKEPTIQKLFVQAWNEIQRFKRVRIKHTRRGNNKEADAEVNKVLNQRNQWIL